MQLPLAFLKGPARLSMGLSALPPEDWLWPDERFPAEVALRARLLAERPGEVTAALPGAEPAVRELLALVEAFTAGHGLASPPEAAGATPLARLCVAAQEDFCVLQRRGRGEEYALTAAALCFPAHWRLRQKLGRPLTEIHAPVPGFAAKLGRPVARFLAGLEVERPVWRANWSVVESPDLFHPGQRPPVAGLAAADAGDRLWLRVERQTLRHLPETRAIVFAIRTLVEPLARTVQRPGAAQAMAERFAEMDGAMAAYKGLPALREPLLAYLRRHAEQTAGPVAQDDPAGGGQRGTP